MMQKTDFRTIPSETALRALARRQRKMPGPDALRAALQSGLAPACAEADPGPCATTPEEWLAQETAFLGYRMELLLRRTEMRLLTLEALDTLAVCLGQTGRTAAGIARMEEDLTQAIQSPNMNRSEQDHLVATLLADCRIADRAWTELAGRFAGYDPDGAWATVFNLFPTRRTMFTCIRSRGPVSVWQGKRRLPSQFIDGDDATAIELEMDGLSIQSLRIEPDGPQYTSRPVTKPYRFENDVLRVVVQPDGRVTDFTSLRHGLQLREGNLLRGAWRDASGHVRTLRGEDMPVTARVVRGELFDNLYLHGEKDGIGMAMVLYLPHHGSRRIEIMLDLTLSETVREDFIHSDGALWLEWHSTMPSPRILCDRPFGWSRCQDGEILRSANGVALTVNGSGIMLDHQGVTRGWAHHGTLYTLLGKGGAGAENDAPAGQLDARTKDAPELHMWRYFYALDLADCDEPEDLFGRIMSYQYPMLPLRTPQPLDTGSLLKVGDGLIPTAFFCRDGQCMVRGWNAAAEPRPLHAAGTWGFSSGRTLKPFGIFEQAL